MKYLQIAGLSAFILMLGWVLIMNIADLDQDLDTHTSGTVSDTGEMIETSEEEMERWMSGNLTDEERAELEAEQKREDEAMERYNQQLEAGISPENVDLETVWQE